MEIRTELNYLRIAPRKVRLIADAIRGKSVPEADATLSFLPRRAAGPVSKLLRAAVADAKQNFQITAPDTLVVARISVDGGPTLKRSRPRAMGRAFPIRKRTSHVVLVLESRGPVPARRRRRKADIAVVAGAAADARESLSEGEGRAGGRMADEAFRTRSRVTTKPTGFVQRMFRRKAI